jgi:hypothetical protein
VGNLVDLCKIGFELDLLSVPANKLQSSCSGWPAKMAFSLSKQTFAQRASFKTSLSKLQKNIFLFHAKLGFQKFPFFQVR